MAEIVTATQLDNHYRIVIHRQHRDNLDWEAGDEVKMTSDGNRLIIEKVEPEKSELQTEQVAIVR